MRRSRRTFKPILTARTPALILMSIAMEANRTNTLPEQAVSRGRLTPEMTLARSYCSGRLHTHAIHGSLKRLPLPFAPAGTAVTTATLRNSRNKPSRCCRAGTPTRSERKRRRTGMSEKTEPGLMMSPRWTLAGANRNATCADACSVSGVASPPLDGVPSAGQRLSPVIPSGRDRRLSAKTSLAYIPDSPPLHDLMGAYLRSARTPHKYGMW